MSYCVNCGVELEKTLNKCPLCNTPVLNPNMPIHKDSIKPYPEEKGQVTPESKTVAAILLSVILSSAAISCALLNLFVFKQNLWSLYIIGVCFLLWIFAIPIFIYTKLSAYITLLLDGVALAIYIGIIAYQYPGRGWYYEIALPIVFLITLSLLFYIFFIQKLSKAFLGKCIVIFSEIGILAVSIELLIRNYFYHKLYITWSAVVLTGCVIIIIMLMTIIKVSSIREEVRRRMHI
jgi:hypothetical protein